MVCVIYEMTVSATAGKSVRMYFSNAVSFVTHGKVKGFLRRLLIPM